jgi:glutathione S-transferase
MWHASSDADKAKAMAAISSHFDFLSDGGGTDYLFGDEPTVADFYLFVMLLWAEKFKIKVPPRLAELAARMKARPAVRTAMANEGLI